MVAAPIMVLKGQIFDCKNKVLYFVNTYQNIYNRYRLGRVER